MRYEHQAECMDKNCRTVTVGIGHRLDGISCPRCGGPVNVRPYENKRTILKDEHWFIRNQIVERKLNHCRPITAEQLVTVIDLYNEYLESKEEEHNESESNTIQSFEEMFSFFEKLKNAKRTK